MPSPGHFTAGKDLVPNVQEVGWAPGLVWMGGRKFHHLPGFDSQTIQPVASGYTGYATLAHNSICMLP